MISEIFIRRPRLASVISLVIVVAGILSIFVLPVTQYPNIAPPTVTVSASYPGADSTVIAEAVGAPLERAINGVQDMLYMSSTSTNAGTYSLSVTFAIGTDPDIAQVNVSNRVQLATSQLPSAVSEQGVTVRTQSPNFLLAIAFYLDDGAEMSIVDAGAYLSTSVTTSIQRVQGVGGANVLGPTDYSMRIWTDPRRMTELNVSPSEIVTAIRNENLPASLGSVGGPPAPDGQALVYTLTAQGQLSEAAAFEDIVVRASEEGGLVRLGDVARVELGAQDYSTNAFVGENPGLVMQVNQAPSANAINTVSQVRAELERMSESFPEGLEYDVVYDATEYVTATIEEIVKTLLITAAIIVVVVFIFLQDWRATVIPLIAIPVSLIGTFAVLLAIGFSINVITLLALILAIGIVVDDAILVVENVQRNMEENDVTGREAAVQAMREITGPIIATTLVLLATFLPTTFLPGITGQLYRQFGLALSISIVLSSVVALTLTPALCGTMLRKPKKSGGVFKVFNKVLWKSRDGYGKIVSFLVRRVALALLALGAAIAVAGFTFVNLPSTLLPPEDQGAILFDVSLPDGASLQRTTEAMQEIGNIIEGTEGVENYIVVAGYSLLNGAQQTSGGLGVITLVDWAQRRDLFTILGQLSGQFSQVPGVQVAAFPPPPIPGLGSVGGFSFELLAQEGQPANEVAQVARSFVAAANQRPEIAGARTTFSADVPRLFVDIDRDRAETLNLSVAGIYDALGSTFGTSFVNQFIYQGRIYQVRVQAEAEARAQPSDIVNLYVKNGTDEMVPVASSVEIETTFGPYILPRFNLFTSASISGNAAQGFSSGAALQALEEVAAETLPDGYSYQFSGTSFQETQSGNVSYLAFALAFVFAYFFLVGQFESWLHPMAIMLSIGVAAMGAALTLLIFGFTSNVYSQIGMVMLIGLAAKNAILIVEFARNRRQDGMEITEAAIMGARQRYRAVLMTALAFVLGLIPLVTASGAGASSRNAIGVAAMGGMIAATFLGIMIIPALYAFFERLGTGRKGKLWGREDADPDALDPDETEIA